MCIYTYVFVLFILVGLVTQTILTERRQCLSILVFKPRLKKTFPAIILETVYNDICTLLLSLKNTWRQYLAIGPEKRGEQKWLDTILNRTKPTRPHKKSKLLCSKWKLRIFIRLLKKVVKSTVFEIEQSFKHILGVAENFWLNCEVKREGPSHQACYILKFLKLDKIHHFYEIEQFQSSPTS